MRKEPCRVFITGASGGLGQALVDVFHRHSCVLFLQCRPQTLPFLKKNLTQRKIKARCYGVDLSLESAIQDLGKQLRHKNQMPHILINNAGLQDRCKLEEIDAAEWDRLLHVNLRAPHLLSSLFSQSGVLQSIVNIASIEGENPALEHAHYDASKGGLIQYSRAAALELGPLGIRVNALSPGLINRSGLKEQWPDGVARYTHASPLSALVEPEEVAEVVYFLSSSKASAITGQNIRVDAGIGASSGY